MTKDLLSQTIDLCRRHGIRPSRSKGQNFLIDPDVYDRIAAAGELADDDTVLEPGPGLGYLTERLARQARQVLAVELDDKLACVLRHRMEAAGLGNVHVHHKDILRFDPLKHLPPDTDYKIIANIPYNITSIFLRNFLTAPRKPGMMVLLIQKEVAARAAAKPPKMSLLALSVQYYGAPDVIGQVGRDRFWPEPDVDSAILRVRLHPEKVDKGEEGRLFRTARVGFSSKRKMLKNNLAGGFGLTHQEAARRLKEAGISEKARAQELSVADWRRIYPKFT